MDGTCGKNERDKKYVKGIGYNPLTEERLEKLGIDGRIQLVFILRK
jgi:hypothetical protein